MNLEWINKFLYVLVAAAIFLFGFLLLGMFVSFQEILLVPDLLTEYNPFGILGIFAALILGGLYLGKIGFTLLRNFFKVSL
ncbi:MAG: hypothetical protein ABID38_01760 [Candidatus Diapherotrites archaeon]